MRAPPGDPGRRRDDGVIMFLLFLPHSVVLWCAVVHHNLHEWGKCGRHGNDVDTRGGKTIQFWGIFYPFKNS